MSAPQPVRSFRVMASNVRSRVRKWPQSKRKALVIIPSFFLVALFLEFELYNGQQSNTWLFSKLEKFAPHHHDSLLPLQPASTTSSNISLTSMVLSPAASNDVPTSEHIEPDQVSDEGSPSFIEKTGTADPEKQQAVVNMMIHAWDEYVEHAWGQDELRPLTRDGIATFGGCTAITIIDAVDTLYIMGLESRYQKARDWIANSLNFACSNSYQSTFETTIRSLGGLMSIYQLTNDSAFLKQAEDLAYRMKDGLRGPIPQRQCNLARSTCSGGGSNLAEIGTLQMEWRALAAETSNKDLKLYRKKAESVVKEMAKDFPQNVLPGNNVYYDRGHFIFSGAASMGGCGDSYYEYLLKVHLQGGAHPKEAWYRKEFERDMKIMLNTMIVKDGHTRVVQYPHMDAMEHLACFVAGSLALSVKAAGCTLTASEKGKFLNTAAELTETCYNMYHLSPSGMSPETVSFHGSQMVPGARYNIQRPEAIEAIFYLWRLTHDQKYRDWGWEMFQSFERVLRVEHGYAGLENAWSSTPRQSNTQSSFFLAETLKYFYLLFSDDTVIPLDEWVFNTEAHPLRVDRTLGENPVI